MTKPLPRNEYGEIDTSAAYGESWLIEITYNTDPEGKWVDGSVDDSNVTLHGPFVDKDEAEAWMIAYPEDTDVYDMRVLNMNGVRPA